MKVHYQPLASNATTIESTSSPFRLLRWCPKFSRWKVLGVIGMVFSALLIVYLCTCCPSSQLNNSGMNIWSSDSPIVGQSTEDTSLNRIRYKHTNRRLPHAIIIGVRKAGTRALLTFLNKHTDVMAAGEEIHFFDREENYSLGIEWYRKHMPYSFPGQITIEKTPAYFHTEEVPELLHQMNSSIKLLIIVRDPVERAISDYYQLYLKSTEHGKTVSSFEEKVLRSDGSINTNYDVIKRSIYCKHLKHWLEYFGKRQIHFVDGDVFIHENPAKELTKVETFLGLRHQLTEDKFFFNTSKGFYCFEEGTDLRCLGDRKGRKHPAVDAGVIRKLRRYYAKYNQRFYEMADRDFGWPENSDLDEEEEE